MKISQQGIEMIKGFEGIHDGNTRTPILEPMQDPRGLWTLGYGSRYDKNYRLVTRYTPAITTAEAETLLIRDIGITEDCIARLVKVPLNQNQYDAICSIIFNIGSGNFQGSLLLKGINKGIVVQSYFTNWRNAGGRPILLGRRQKEWQLYAKPVV